MKNKSFLTLVANTLLVIFLGCGSDAGPAVSSGPLPPLSVEEWKQLPIQEKYDEATFERLRAKDEKLQAERAWGRFMREVVVPERKRDIPGIPGQ